LANSDVILVVGLYALCLDFVKIEDNL